MLATGRWRVAAAALACAALSAAITTAALGLDIWTTFLSSLSDTNKDIFEEAWAGLSLNASAFGAMRVLGGSIAVAWTVQGLVSLAALGIVLKLWLSPCPQDLRNGSLIAAIPLVSPYVPVYDLAVLVPAGAFFILGVRGALTQGERIAILALYALAINPREVTKATHLSCGFLVAGGTFALIAFRAWKRMRSVPSSNAAGCATPSLLSAPPVSVVDR